MVVGAQIGCTFADIVLWHPTESVAERCNSFVQEAHHQLLEAVPGVVVIANAHLWWVEESDIRVGIVGEAPTRDPIARLDVLRRGLAATVGALEEAGHRVIIVQVIPMWGDGAEALSWSTCSVFEIRAGGCRQSFYLNDASARQTAIWESLEVVARQSGAELIDLAPVLCSGCRCESESAEGTIRSRDGTHLTVEQSEALAPIFDAFIDSGD